MAVGCTPKQNIFICQKMEINLISAICVTSFGMATAKITCFIHNAFCFTASQQFSFLPAKIHISVSAEQLQWLSTGQGCCSVVNIVFCCPACPKHHSAQAQIFHGFQRSRNHSPPPNPSTSTHRAEETTFWVSSFL